MQRNFSHVKFNTIHSETVSNFGDEFNLKYLLALSIHIDVVSGHTDKKLKELREQNWSGYYFIVGIVNDRPAYKVSFC